MTGRPTPVQDGKRISVKKTVALQNLGCSKNLIDGERILHLFRKAGYEPVEDLSGADIIVVNTCAFIREAQEEAIETILEMASQRKTGQCRKLIVSGCFSQRYRDKVRKEFPEVDIWVGVDDWEKLLGEQLQTTSVPEYERSLQNTGATQYLKIAEGCSHGCTFCVIPSIRGPFKSRTHQSIITEAQWLYERGTRELILVAQDSSFYGKDTNSSLQALLEQLLKETSFPWIRMMYLHPRHVDDSLLRLVAAEKRICPYFDIPLQHISDPILKGMNRTPLSSGIEQLIEKIRITVPDAGIRTAFIIGFPGETNNDFRLLLQFIERTRFDKLGCFPYSPEEGTKAAVLRSRSRTSTVQRRCEEIMTLQREISREKLETFIGKRLEVIIDRIAEDPDFNFEGRTRIDAPEIDGNVLISNGSCVPGTILTVEIKGTGDYDLYGEFSGL
jgi:ribosomal protein S12 methylthiotransferase